MLARTFGAFMRAVLVALLIATPALLLPGVASDTSQIVVLIAILAGLLTYMEYYSLYPSIVEFRFAPPFNRLRFVALFFTVFLLTVICRGITDPTNFTGFVTSLGVILGNAIDFPYSPVRLVVLTLPADASHQLVATVRTAAGIAYLVSLVAMFCFVTMVRIFGWPARGGVFNVWVNLPLFDPTAGGDVLHRLKRDASLNIVLGFLLPFLIPAVIKAAADMIDPITMSNPQTLIWTISAWAFLPASMIMRGIAMSRIADMIEEKRRRTYAEADSDAMQTA
ncbi:hypothetical protein NBRC116596_15450 [Litorivita sp. NS0012-18]